MTLAAPTSYCEQHIVILLSVADFPDDQPSQCGFLCIFNLRSVQLLDLLTVKLYSKEAPIELNSSLASH